MNNTVDYTLEYEPNNYKRRQMIRKYMLAIGVVLDILALASIFSVIVQPIYLLVTASIIAVRVISTILINRYPIKYRYEVLDDRIIVSAIVPSNTKVILDKKCKDISKVYMYTSDNASHSNFDIFLYDNSCKIDPYVLEFSDKMCVFALDEYMYTLINDKKGQ